MTERVAVNMAWSSIHCNDKVKSTESCKIHTKQIDNSLESFFTCSEMLLKQEWLLLRFISTNISICIYQKWEWFKDSCISIMPCKFTTVTTALNTQNTLKLLLKWLPSLAYRRNNRKKPKKLGCLFLNIFRRRSIMETKIKNILTLSFKGGKLPI